MTAARLFDEPQLDVVPHPDRRHQSAEADAVASAFEERLGEIVAEWSALGADGPTCGSSEAGEDDFSRRRYLTPLARLLIGALRGSFEHKAVYLDERLRYLPPGLDAAGRREMLGHLLQREQQSLIQLAASAVDAAVAHRVLTDLHSELIAPVQGEALRLLLVGDCIFNDTRAFLARHESVDRGTLEIDHVYFSATVDSAVSTADIAAAAERSDPHLIGLSLFTFEGIPLYSALLADAWRSSGREIEARSAALVALLADTVGALRQVTDAPIILHNVCGLPLDRFRRRMRWLSPHGRGRAKVTETLSRLIRELAEATENAILLDEAELAAEHGGLRACGLPVFDNADVPEGVFHPTRLGPALANRYAEIANAFRVLGRAKVLLVDFDNTLWSGVMADGAVTHDRRAQGLLKRLREAGVLLVALSKNDPALIRWEEMTLAPDDFVLHKINWEPKPDSVSAAIGQLDLDASAFVLLDDNPVERALVTGEIPAVRALDPLAPATWRALENWLSFPSTTQTPEARKRTEMYREAAERREAISGIHDYGQMMSSLKLHADFRKAGDADMERLLELIQRTNQFNTTTRRRSASEVAALLASGTHGVYVSSLRDRFGDLGVVGVVVLEHDGETVVFDSVIMSCRAMGFGLEQFLVARAMSVAPARRYVGLIIPTDRNGPAQSLFRQLDFREDAPGNWVLDDTARLPRVPDWLA